MSTPDMGVTRTTYRSCNSCGEQCRREIRIGELLIALCWPCVTRLRMMLIK